MARKKVKPEDLVQAVADIKEDEAIRISKELLESGEDPNHILELARQGTLIVGQRYDSGDYFLSELVMSGEMLRGVGDVVKPKLKKASPVKHIGKFLIGTVKGDVHDVGKNIVAFMFEVNGFEVMNLGVDVPPETFVKKIVEFKPDVLGMSGLLSVSFDSMKATVDAIKKAGLRNKVKIVIGGSLADDKVRDYVGADAYKPDPTSAVTQAKAWIGR